MKKSLFLIMAVIIMISCQCEQRENTQESWLPNMEEINLLQIDKVLADELNNRGKTYRIVVTKLP